MVFFAIFLAFFGSYIIYKLAKPKENKNGIKNNKINSTKKITVKREKYFNEDLVDLSYFIENNDLIKDLKGLGAKLLFFKDPPQSEFLADWIYYSKSTDQIRSVDVHNQACDCDDFKKYRFYFPKNSTPRLCNCLYKISRELSFCSQIHSDDPLIDEYAKDLYERVSPHPHFVYLTAEGSNKVLITHELERSWVNVFSYGKRRSDNEHKTGSIGKFGFKGFDYLDGSSWSHGVAPVGGAAIRSIIQKLPTLNVVKNDLVSILPSFSLINIRGFTNKGVLLSDSVLKKLHEEILKNNNIKNIIQILIIFSSNGNNSKNSDTKNDYHVYWKKLLKTLMYQNYIHMNLFNPLISDDPLENLIKIEQSLSTVKECSIRSIEQIEQEIFDAKRNEGLNIVGEIVASKNFEATLIEELEAFEKLDDCQVKVKALSVLNTPLPEWYDKTKGHTHRGYEFSNFADAIVDQSNINHLSKAEEITVAYFSSLALKDKTTSIRTLARMLKYKGVILKTLDKKIQATVYRNASSRLNKF